MTTIDILVVQLSVLWEVGADDDAEVGADDGAEVDHHSLKWYSIIKISFNQHILPSVPNCVISSGAVLA